MKTLTRILLCAAMLATAFAARAERTFNQAELDALLAPVALYPDSVLSSILVAASYPDDVREAAAWSRGSPQLRGDEALRMVDSLPWQPSVKALVAFPEVLARMDESPAWLRDLSDAYRVHGPYVMDTVQSLRHRAQASGYLRSDAQRQVYDDAGAIVVAPASPQVVYVPYYDPYVVYGSWWWPAYRPVVWHPWPVFGTFISVGFFASHADWHRRVVVVNRPVYVNRPVSEPPGLRQSPRSRAAPGGCSTPGGRSASGRRARADRRRAPGGPRAVPQRAAAPDIAARSGVSTPADRAAASAAASAAARRVSRFGIAWPPAAATAPQRPPPRLIDARLLSRSPAMIIETQQDVTEAVVGEMLRTPDPRTKEILSCLVRHLHAFVREAKLTEKEFQEAIGHVNAIGQKTTPSHNEAMLLSGSLGVSNLVCLMNNGAKGMRADAGQQPGARSTATAHRRCADGASFLRSPTPGRLLSSQGFVRMKRPARCRRGGRCLAFLARGTVREPGPGAGGDEPARPFHHARRRLVQLPQREARRLSGADRRSHRRAARGRRSATTSARRTCTSSSTRAASRPSPRRSTTRGSAPRDRSPVRRDKGADRQFRRKARTATTLEFTSPRARRKRGGRRRRSPKSRV